MDKSFQETDRISPHYGHLIQPLGDGAWHCLRCEGALTCPDCGYVTRDGERCAECLSEQASYFVEGGQG
jgi:hypothetical protein